MEDGLVVEVLGDEGGEEGAGFRSVLIVEFEADVAHGGLEDDVFGHCEELGFCVVVWVLRFGVEWREGELWVSRSERRRRQIYARLVRE